MKKLFTQSILLLLVLFAGTISGSAVTESDISMELYRISDRGPSGAPLSQYTLASRNSFTSTTGDIYVSGTITNKTNSKIELNAFRFMVAFGYQTSPYTAEVYNGGGDKISTITLPAHDYADVTIKIPANWNGHLEKTSDNYTYLDFYFIYAEGSGLHLFTGPYSIIDGKQKVISEQATIASMNLTTKSANSIASIASNIRMEPIEVSRYYNHSYEDIMQYRPYTNKYYYMGYENLNVKFTVKNKTNEPLTFTSNKFTISYNGATTYNILNITDESYNLLPTVTIPANSTIKIIMHLGNEWYDNRENPNNPEYYQPVSLIPYYDGVKTDYMSYSYLFSRAALKSLSVTPSVVTSDVTVKSTDKSSIKSVKIIGSMGNIVKTKSYNSNCIETSFDLSNCKNDIYYIQVEKTNGVETVKVIKKQ